MLVCREAARLISDSYQRPLRWSERVSLRLHLTICDACTNFNKQMRLLTDAARRFKDMQIEGLSAFRLSNGARQRIREILETALPDE